MAKQFLLNDVTVEPALFFYLCANYIVEFLNTNLFLQKSCRYNHTTEPDLSTLCDDERRGVLFVSEVNSNFRFVTSTLCMIYLILATCWSDEAGKRRRILIFLPIVCLFLQSVVGGVHSYFWYWMPEHAALWSMLLEIIGGGSGMILVASQIYICDVSTVENRTMRLGLLWLARSTGIPLGKGSAGFLLRYVGFFYSYVVCAALSIISLCLAVIFIKDISVPVKRELPFWHIFKLTQIVDSFRVVFKRKLASKRIIVVLLLVINVLGWFSFYGEQSVAYLLLKHKFKWTEQMFSVYQVYKYVGVMLGTSFCSIVLSKLLKLHDGAIGAFAAFHDTITVVGYLTAKENWHLYIIPLFDIFHGVALSISNSFLSKFYDSDEFGRLYTVVCVFGLLVPFGYPVYNLIFQETVHVFPPTIFIISIAINVVIVLLYCSTYFLDKRLSIGKSSEKEQEPMMSIKRPCRIVNHEDLKSSK